MTDKDLKRLRRDELLEMLIAQSKRMEQMQEELDAARAALASREILLQEAGSIAEASLRINGVFEAAQAAAQQYLENIRRMSGLPPESADVLPEDKEEAPPSPENETQDQEAEVPEKEPDTPQEKKKLRPLRKKGRNAGR